MNSATQALFKLIHDRDDAAAARALLDQGADPNALNEDAESTPLLDAILFDHDETVAVLLAHGGDISLRVLGKPPAPLSPWTILKIRPFSPIFWFLALFELFSRDRDLDTRPELLERGAESQCDTLPMARLLIQNGADMMLFGSELRPAVTGADLIAPQNITPDLFQRWSQPREGTANPQVCDSPFYREQMRSGNSGYAAKTAVLGDVNVDATDPPVWSFSRFGQTATPLADGRLVLIAGEHEDFYDADFYIYNDVTVLDSSGDVQYFIYPKDVFPPTDFHTATLLQDHIILIGALSHPELRRENQTQVLRLNLSDFSIDHIETRGENPGWINSHSAELIDSEIHIWGGKVEPGYQDLEGRYALDLTRAVWRRLE
ncbi:MAG: hypothetical protein KUG69_03205 [Marinosulfonomonas sp.]|nr:hypothetical protein [Marinosulfonomonas sp.]